MTDSSADLTIQSHRGPYTVRFTAPFAGLETGLSETEHLIIDRRVAELYAAPLAAALSGRSVLRIEATEANKSLEAFPAYFTHLLDQRVRRDHTLVAVGGGILQDITSFMAATLLRGVRWRFYPTTLLAQADSCIGSKSSVNVGGQKNQVGTYTPPEDIRIATGVLETLTEADRRSGIGEIIKVHVIAGWDRARAVAADYPRLLTDRAALREYIRQSLLIKQVKIEADEFDRGDRVVMNYGHSFGHAIESCTHYAVPHGIAISIGMDMANFTSWRLGLAPRRVFDELHPVLAANYAGFERTDVPFDALMGALGKDKKNLGRDVVLILLSEPGRLFQHRVTDGAALQAICREYFECLAAGTF